MRGIPIRMRGVPRRPMPSPVALDPQMILKSLQEVLALKDMFFEGLNALQEAKAAFETIKQGRPGISGRSVVLEDVVREVLKQLPYTELDEERLRKVAQMVFRKMPKPKRGKKGKDAELPQVPTVEQILEMFFEALKTGKKKLFLKDIEGAEGRFAEVRNQIALRLSEGPRPSLQGKQYGTTTWTRGGGGAAAGLGAWSTPAETPDSVITAFTVGSTAPTDVVADGTNFYEGAGYTYAAGQITFTNPPSLYVRYR